MNRHNISNLLNEIGDQTLLFLSSVQNKVKTAFREEPWFATAMGLIWAAGPVCYLGLTLGYYMGYGVPPDTKLFYYFSVYIFASGVLTVAGKIVVNSLNTINNQRERQVHYRVIEKILALKRSANNIYLRELPPTLKKIEEAKIILGNPDAMEADIEVGLGLLTENPELLQSIKAIEVFRHHGLIDRIETELAKVKPEVMKLVYQLQRLSPELAIIIESRFSGKTPSKKIGDRRSPGLLGRAQLSNDFNTTTILSISDVNQLLTFAYELLFDRQICGFKCNLYGTKYLVKNSAMLDSYIVTFNTLYNQRNVLIEKIITIFNHFNTAPVKEKRIKKWGMAELNTLWSKGLEFIDNEIDAKIEQEKEKDADMLELNNYLTRIKEKSADLENLYKMCWELTEILTKHWHRLSRIIEHYQIMQQRFFRQKNKSPDLIGKFRIYQDVEIIKLSNGQKRDMFLELDKLFAHLAVNADEVIANKHITPDDSLSNLEASENLKSICQKVLTLIDRQLEISKKGLEIAIESSHSPNIGSIEPGLSRKTVIDWSQLLVEEVQADIPNMIYKCIQWVVSFRAEKLTEKEVNELCRHFELDRHQLHQTRPIKVLDIQNTERYKSVNQEKELGSLLEDLESLNEKIVILEDQRSSFS